MSDGRERFSRIRRIMSQPQYRQGDLLFVLREARPGKVIVEGEATGYAHRLTSGVVLDGSDGSLYLDLPEIAWVVHEEHDAITLGPGQ